MNKYKLTSAAKVRKAFFTGRPASLPEPVSPIIAIGVLYDKLMKLIKLQTAEKDLSEDDVAGYLVWTATDRDNLNKTFVKRLHGRADTGTLLERVNSYADMKILGLMFVQIDGKERHARLMPMVSAKEDVGLLMSARLQFLKKDKYQFEN